jgi:hypothetical protein
LNVWHQPVRLGVDLRDKVDELIDRLTANMAAAQQQQIEQALIYGESQMAHTINWNWVQDYLGQAGFSLHRYIDRMKSAIRCDVCGWFLDVDDFEMASGTSVRPICDQLKAHACKPVLVSDLMADLEFAGKEGVPA